MRAWILAALLAAAAAVESAVAIASAPPTVTLSATLTPDRLRASANLAMTMTLAQSPGVPDPLREVIVYGPAGIGVDVSDIASCAREKLEAAGPSGCPAQSRIGFGGGTGEVEVSGSTVKESYTLDLFRESGSTGHLGILVYVSATSPVPVRLVLSAREVHGPRPFGVGFAVAVPPVATVPGLANASVESAFVSVGGANIAYYKTVHGRRRLFSVHGLTVPRSCPAGGFPFEVLVVFEDGSKSTARSDVPCPRGRS